MKITVRGKKYYTGTLWPDDNFLMIEFYDDKGNVLVDSNGEQLAEYLTKLFDVYDGPDTSVGCSNCLLSEYDPDFRKGEVSQELWNELINAVNSKLSGLPYWRHKHINYRRFLKLSSNPRGPLLNHKGEITYYDLTAKEAKTFVKQFEKILSKNGWKWSNSYGWENDAYVGGFDA